MHFIRFKILLAKNHVLMYTWENVNFPITCIYEEQLTPKICDQTHNSKKTIQESASLEPQNSLLPKMGLS